MARLAGRDAAPDRLESAGDAFHRRTRAAFLDRAAADPDRWLVLDAARPVEEVAEAVRARVAALLGLGERA
jgi:dTMP kinase